MTPAKTGCGHDRRPCPAFTLGAAARVPWPARDLAGRGADPETDSFPTALEALRAVPSILGDKESLINILASLRRMAIAFSVAGCGVYSARIDDGPQPLCGLLFNPLLMITYPVPKAALMPIIMLWLGVGDLGKNAGDLSRRQSSGDLSQLPGRKGGRREVLWSGAAMGLSAAQRLIRIVLPAALPEILTGCRTRARAALSPWSPLR